MLLDKKQSLLWLIDLQERLISKISNAEKIIHNSKWLLSLADECLVPIMIAEQYPKGLGKTVSDLEIWHNLVLEKHEFSAYQNKLMYETLNFHRKNQIILLGIETHVCILQTALDLLSDGYSVYVVIDCVSSRNKLDHKYALKRLKQAGVMLITKEMVFFEWLQNSNAKNFKELSKYYFS